MSDKVKIDQPIEVKDSSAERVALELTKWIELREPKESKADMRKYILDLYSECLEATKDRRSY